MSNNLIVIENRQINTYQLDDRLSWEVGRPSKDNNPDIKLYSTVISRKHGRFDNTNGTWFYTDYYGKNGTVYNNEKLTRALNGMTDSEKLEDGDVFVFGGSERFVLDKKTVWALFTERDFFGGWRVVDAKDYGLIAFSDGISKTDIKQLKKGTVVELDDGMAIYMGELTYLTGSMNVSEGAIES